MGAAQVEASADFDESIPEDSVKESIGEDFNEMSGSAVDPPVFGGQT